MSLDVSRARRETPGQALWLAKHQRGGFAGSQWPPVVGGASEPSDELCYQGARARKAVSNDLAVELLAVPAAFGPPGFQVRFVGSSILGRLGMGLRLGHSSERAYLRTVL